MHATLRPYCHRMEHEVADVGLLSLVHHVVVFVNVEDVRGRDTGSPPSVPPVSECVIVSFNNQGHRPVRPGEEATEVNDRVRHEVEVVEVDVEDGIHRLLLLPNE